MADARIQAVIVTAPKDLMEEIAGMMKDLDVPSDRDQDVYVFKMNNGDPQQVAQVLQTMFQSTSSRNTQQFVAKQRAPAAAHKQRHHHRARPASSSTGFGTTGGGGGGAAAEAP